MTSARLLMVFNECDPSHPIFNGFRKGKDFYTSFCGRLLQGITTEIPTICEIQFDAFPSVSRDGPLMTRLVAEAKRTQKSITWGPLRGWD